MKVLLIKDVYKLGKAGEIKKVADGYGRNFLIPKKLAVPATDGSIKLAERISKKATEKRAELNKEFASVAEVLSNISLEFSVKAGETGKLYGSVSSQMVVDQIKDKYTIEIDRHQLAMEPIRELGEYTIPVHLTLDLIPEISVLVHREGEVIKEKLTPQNEQIVKDEANNEDLIVDSDVNIDEINEETNEADLSEDLSEDIQA